MIGRSQEERILSSKLEEAELIIKDLTQCNVKLLSERRKLQSRLEELNQKVTVLQQENASLKPMAERYVWLRDHYHGFEHYRSELAKKMNMFENDISKAMRSTDSQ